MRTALRTCRPRRRPSECCTNNLLEYDAIMLRKLRYLDRAHKVARKLAKEARHRALLAEDDSKPWYIKYSRKAYRAAMHGMDVDVHAVRQQQQARRIICVLVLAVSNIY